MYIWQAAWILDHQKKFKTHVFSKLLIIPNEADGVVDATPQKVAMGLLHFVKCI